LSNADPTHKNPDVPTMPNRDPRPLFILELANNHMGDLQHGLRIVRECHEAARPFLAEFRVAFKLQYRDLETFIHPAYAGRSDLKYVKRFSETRLSQAEFVALKEEMHALGCLAVCTPFDERSVKRIEEHGFDMIKAASCSVTDWPLLERIVRTDRPVIASAAGASLEDLDRVVSFFEHREKDFTLLHCVGEYPTPAAGLQLNQIGLFRERYPNLPVGYSTHEEPTNYDSVKLAVAKGATVFEKHVGVPTDRCPLNAYSATPEQVGRWLKAAREAFAMCGTAGERSAFSPGELGALRNLRRGVFARRSLAPGERIDAEAVFLAIPVTSDDQLTANDLSKYTEFHAARPIAAGEPVTFAACRCVSYRRQVQAIMEQVKAVLERSHVPVPRKLDFEISHHYGIERFNEYGLTIINIVNREYCKKLLILVPGQSHPEQYHKLKEETFHVLFGTVTVLLDGRPREYAAGDVVTIERGVRHAFSTPGGAVVEEISSTHYVEDSYYTDPAIAANSRRKTLITYWVR
jgi:sialic acid synthase SpsE/quercetin dioxygenase-like cupin family protein